MEAVERMLGIDQRIMLTTCAVTAITILVSWEHSQETFVVGQQAGRLTPYTFTTPGPIPRGGPMNVFSIPGSTSTNISATPEGVRVNYVVGKFGSLSGGSFKAAPPGLPADAATLSYDVFIPESFQWSVAEGIKLPGGKFPGMCIGIDPKGCASGGKFQATAGSYRPMWRDNGQLIGYSYHAVAGDPNNVFKMQGDEFKAVSKFSGTAGTGVWHKIPGPGGPLQLKKNAWNAISMTVVLNTPGKANGTMTLSCNGLTKTVGGVLWREQANVKVCNVDFVTFAGGGSADWAFVKPTYTIFRNIKFGTGVPVETFAGKELVSSTVAKVKGLVKSGKTEQCYKGDRAPINPPKGAPKNAGALRKAARVYTTADAKKMMAVTVDDAWPVMKQYFNLVDAQKTRFLALMLGQSTAESTLCIDVETGTDKGYNKNPAHAWGLLQTAVTAFKGSSATNGDLPDYDNEDDVPEMKHYDFTPENFYDPMISHFMGLRKMAHFAKEAKEKYKITDKWEVLRMAVTAHNIGHANPKQTDEYFAFYPDMCARMGEWYFKNKHLDDDAFTWTGNFSGFPSSFTPPAKGKDWKKNWEWFWK